MNDYDAKVVFVTGGGTGIGKATATAFVEEGATVVTSRVVAAFAKHGAPTVLGSVRGEGGVPLFEADWFAFVPDAVVPIHGLVVRAGRRR